MSRKQPPIVCRNERIRRVANEKLQPHVFDFVAAGERLRSAGHNKGRQAGTKKKSMFPR